MTVPEISGIVFSRLNDLSIPVNLTEFAPKIHDRYRWIFDGNAQLHWDIWVKKLFAHLARSLHLDSRAKCSYIVF